MLCAASAQPIADEEQAATRIQAHFRGRRARIKSIRKRHQKQQDKKNENADDSRRLGDNIYNQGEQDGLLGSVSYTPSVALSASTNSAGTHASNKRAHLEEPEPMDILTTSSGMSEKPFHMAAHTIQTDYVSLRRQLEGRDTKLPATIQRLRVSAYLLLDEPRSSCAAQVMSVVLLTMIIVSIVCFVIETMPELKHVSKDTWLAIEVFCVAIFTLEYMTRISVCTVAGKSVWQFVKTPTNMFDLLAIFPFYLWVAMRSLQMAKALGVLRTVRLVRLFRIFKLGRYSSGLQLMAEALRKSSQALSVLSFFLCIGIVLFSSAVYYVEKMGCPDKEELQSGPRNGDPASNQTEWDGYVIDCRLSKDGWHQQHGLCCDEHGSPLDFPSIVDTFWWSTVTMTTVGFGEVYPRTELGRLVAEVTMLSGILLIALPVAIIGREFQKAYDKHHLYQSLGDISSVESQSINSSAFNEAGTMQSSASKSPKKEPASAIVQAAQPDGPSLSEMGRRLRLMKFGDDLSSLARDLAEDLEEAGELQKEICSMQKVERERQIIVIDNFETVLRRFQNLREGADSIKRAKTQRLKKGGLAGIIIRAKTKIDTTIHHAAQHEPDRKPHFSGEVPMKKISSEVIAIEPSPLIEPPLPPKLGVPPNAG